MPSSWTRTRRASANAASASACRPHRYSASISCPLNRSLSGCARTSSVSWPAASAARPSSSRTSMCSSVAVSRCSPSPARTISAHGPGMPSSATPCHSPIADSSDAAAADRSPARRDSRAAASRPANSSASSWPGDSRSRYPRPLACSTWPDVRCARPGSRAARNREIWTCSAFTDRAGSSSPQIPSISSSRETAWFARAASSPRTARRCGAPSSSSVPPRQARTGPSTATRTGRPSSARPSSAPPLSARPSPASPSSEVTVATFRPGAQAYDA